MAKWNHAFDFAYEVKTKKEDPEKVTGAELRKALQARLDSLTDDDLVKACNCFDSHQDGE